MLRRIWRSLVRWFRRLFGLSTPDRTEARRGRQSFAAEPRQVESPKPLEDTDYEFLFMQLLEGVAHGWQESRVLKFKEDLKARTTEAEWVAWLRRFGERLLAAPTPNQELALRMLRLREVSGGELEEVAGSLGEQMLLQEDRQQGSSQTPVFATPQPFPETPEDIAAQTVTLEELFEMLQQDETLVQQLTQQLQIDTTDPQAIMEALINQANALAQSPVDEAEVWFNLGVQQHIAGELEAAIASYDQSLKLNPHSPAVWSNRGVALAGLQRYEEALTSLERVLEMQPNDAVAWNNRGQALADLGRYSEAIASFDCALAIEPSYEEAQINRDKAVAEMG